MRLAWAVIPLVLVGIVGIIEIQDSFAGPPPIERIPVFNSTVSGIDGSSIIRPNEPVTIRADYREDFPNQDYVIIFQITNQKGQVVLLNWIEKNQKNFDDNPGPYLCGAKLCYDEDVNSESFVCGDKICKSKSSTSKFVETLWRPSESGTHTMKIFSWEAIDNPTALSPPLSATIHVNKIELSAFSENKPNVISKCNDIGGTWLDQYNECESSSRINEFENYCSYYDGIYDGCHSGCRHSPDWPNVDCAAQCVAVCEFE